MPENMKKTRDQPNTNRDDLLVHPNVLLISNTFSRKIIFLYRVETEIKETTRIKI